MELSLPRMAFSQAVAERLQEITSIRLAILSQAEIVDEERTKLYNLAGSYDSEIQALKRLQDAHAGQNAVVNASQKEAGKTPLNGRSAY